MSENSLLEKQGKLVKGRPLYQNLPPDTTGKLIWHPTVATISNAGDLGYTSGPYTYQVKNKEVVSGNFATVWEKQPDGKWKFVIDLGNSTGANASATNEQSTKIITPEQLSSSNNLEPNLFQLDQNLNDIIHQNSQA